MQKEGRLQVSDSRSIRWLCSGLLLMLGVLLLSTSVWATISVSGLIVNTKTSNPVTVYSGVNMELKYNGNAPGDSDVIRSIQVLIRNAGGSVVRSGCDVLMNPVSGPGHSMLSGMCLLAPNTPGTYTMEVIPYEGSDCSTGDVGTHLTRTLIVEDGPTTTDASGSAGTIISGESFTITTQVTSCVSHSPCANGSDLDYDCSNPSQLIGTVRFRDETANAELGTKSIWESGSPQGDETVQLITSGLLRHPTESIHTISVTYEASSGTPWHGDSADTFQVTVLSDSELPSITCPDPISADADPGSCTTSVSFEATATDNVSAEVTYSISGTPITSPHAFSSGETTVTAVATDPSGNTRSCSFTVTVNDTQAPVITCPPNITVECDSGIDPADTGEATATDNCGTPAITYADVSNLAGCGSTGTITRTWTATDDDDNTESCAQVITVVDTTPPALSLPPNLDVECGQSTDPADTGEASAIDGCSTAIVNYSDSFEASGCGGTGTITRTWTATDGCGNSSNMDQIITIVDTTIPSMTCPANVTVQCLADVPAADPALVTTADDCDPSPVVTHREDHALQTGTGAYTISRIYRSTDCEGNWNECTQTITVEDTTAPSISLLGSSPMSVQCGSTYNEPGASVSDNCCINAGDLAIDASAVNTSLLGTYSVTYNISDCAGNPAPQQIRSVTVIDTTTPTITLLGDNPMSILEGGTYTELGANVSDACPGCVDANDLVIDSSTIDTATPGSYIATYDIVDCHGNASHETRIVNVIDITPPIIEIRTPSNLAVYLLHEIVLADWTVSGADGGTVQASALQGALIDTSTGGKHVFTVIAEDASGNVSKASVSYSVQYKLQIDPTTGVIEFVVVAEDEEDSVPPEEVLTIDHGLPIHIGCALLDVAGESVTNLELTLSIVRVLPGENGETYEILHLIIVAYNQESGCYAQTLCEAEGILLLPGTYDLWLGLGDGRSLRQRVVIESSDE